ncbi:hypothetical protein BD413DRAFT_614557 [Trametes elegans]|nr:hypothetical protein BD413DRAFT_614557 [Trametes elegans]
MLAQDPFGSFNRALDEAANLLARNIGPSVEVIKLPRGRGSIGGYEWVAYKVVRDAEDGPRAQYDEYLTYGRIRPSNIVNAESRQSLVAERYSAVMPGQDLVPVVIGA